MRKTILQDYKSCSVQKNRSKKHQIFQKLGNFEYRPSCIGYSPCKMVSLGQKLKNAKNMRKTILQDYKSCSVEKTTRKNTKYSRNQTILKISYLAKAIAHAKAIAFAKWSVWVKN